jgi:hypothetical protein
MLDNLIAVGSYTLNDLQRIAYFNRKYSTSLTIRPAGI